MEVREAAQMQDGTAHTVVRDVAVVAHEARAGALELGKLHLRAVRIAWLVLRTRDAIRVRLEQST